MRTGLGSVRGPAVVSDGKNTPWILLAQSGYVDSNENLLSLVRMDMLLPSLLQAAPYPGSGADIKMPISEVGVNSCEGHQTCVHAWSCRFLPGVKPHKILPGGGIFPPEDSLNGSGGTFREIRNDFLVGSLLEGEIPIKRHGHLLDTA